jgi:hypothetical protein
MSYLIQSRLFAASTEKKFVHFDSEQQFAINQAELGRNWRWYNVEFTYRINNHGYRMNKELHEVDFNNYIAFFGCSYTVGAGLPLQNTFAYQIAQNAKMDYVNAAAVGSSVDFVFYNFTKLISEAPKLPKIVVINWPDIARTMYWYENNIIDFVPALDVDMNNPNSPNAIKFWANSYKNYVLESSNFTNRFEYIRQNIITLCRLTDIKLFEFTVDHSYVNSNIYHAPWLPKWPIKLQGQELLDFQNQYFARDIMPKNYRMFDFLTHNRDMGGWAHPGVEFQNHIVNKFFSTITI